MSIEAIASAAAAVAVSPYLASLTLTAPDRADRRWWRPGRAGAGRIAITAACAAVLALLAAAAARPTNALPAFLALALLGAVLVVVDVEHHRLPDRITLAVAVLGTAGLTGAAAVDGAWPDLTRAGLATAAVFALFYGLALISPRGIGLGDVKLAGLLAGFLGWLGWASVIAGLAVGFAAAGALGILLLATRRATRRTHIPLGPFLIVAALAVAAYGVQPTTRTVILPPSVPAAAGAAALAQLDRLPVLAYRPHPGGYERGCGEGQACSFGPAWSDDVDVAGGHDGCDTRNGILAAQLPDAAFKQGSWCVVVAGVLEDPYTGRRLQFAKADAAQMPVDHLIPLALAWDLGASSWPAQQRQDFANDPRELQLTDKATNDAKADSGPGEWMPPNRGYHCTYAARFVEVAAAYRVPVTAADAAALRTVLAGCP